MSYARRYTTLICLLRPEKLATRTAFPVISESRPPPEFFMTAYESGIYFATLLAATATANVWRKRLGHPNGQIMDQVKNVSKGVEFDSSTLFQGDMCKINIYAPIKRTERRQGAPGAREHRPSKGPIRSEAKDRSKYIVKYTGHHSMFKAIYIIAKKSDALSTLFKFVQDLAIPLGLRMQHRRTDNGGENTPGDFREILQHHRDQQQFTTTPNTPQQNGIPERDGRTVMNMIRCLVHEARLPKNLWGENCSHRGIPDKPFTTQVYQRSNNL